MKTILYLIILSGILFLTNSCQKIIDNASSGNENVFVGGTQGNGNNSVATYWKNGVATSLTDGNVIYAMAVSGNDIYAAGIGHDTLKFWKNGVSTSLGEIVVVNQYVLCAMKVVGNDVYIAATVYEGMNTVAKFWKNGVETRLTDGSRRAEAYAIAVSGNDVYVLGTEDDGARNNISKFWKNGTAVILPDFIGGLTTSMAVVGNDVYIGGSQLNGTVRVPAYWKNGVVTKLADGTKDEYVSAIAVDEDNTVHLAGYKYTTFNHTIARYWNSKGTSTNLSDGTTANHPHAIAVYGKDVFIAGDEISGPNGYNYIIAKYWKNSTPIDLGSKFGNPSGAKAICVTD